MIANPESASPETDTRFTGDPATNAPRSGSPPEATSPANVSFTPYDDRLNKGLTIYLDKGLTGTQPAVALARPGPRSRPRRRHPRRSETRPARPVGSRRPRHRRLPGRLRRPSLGDTIHDPSDPMGKTFFNILATFEFEVDLLRLRTREGMAVARPRASYAANSPTSPPAATPIHASPELERQFRDEDDEQKHAEPPRGAGRRPVRGRGQPADGRCPPDEPAQSAEPRGQQREQPHGWPPASCPRWRCRSWSTARCGTRPISCIRSTRSGTG